MNKILFVDTLTTGMNIERCSIYRIGGIYTEDGMEKKRFEFNIKPFPGSRISDQSLWIGGVDRAILASYPSQESSFEKFTEMLDGFVDVRNPRDKMYLAGFNSAAFDAPFIWEWFKRNQNDHIRDYFHVQIIDMMSIAAFCLMNERWQMQDFKLESVARQMRINTGNEDTFNCLANAKTCLSIYKKIKERFGIEEFPDSEESHELITNQ